MTALGDFVARSFVDVYAVPADTAILEGAVPAAEATEPGIVVPFGFRIPMSRLEAIDHGFVEPTAAEREVMEANSRKWAADHAARVARGKAWFEAVRAAAGPVAVAMLDLHVSDEYGDCKGCGFEALAGIAWPCATVLAGAQAAGVPAPAGI